MRTSRPARDARAPNQGFGLARADQGHRRATLDANDLRIRYSLSGTQFGTVFKVNKTGKLTVLHSFTGGKDGAIPAQERLLRDAAGNLYGTTNFGGNVTTCPYFGEAYPGCGVVFKITP